MLIGLALLGGGLVAGVFGSLLGLGGGILIVPFLSLVFWLPIQQAFGDSLDDKLELLAFYFARGGDLERALEYLEQAANRATSLRAHTQAAQFWSRAAAVAEKVNDPDARDRIERRLVELGA